MLLKCLQRLETQFKILVRLLCANYDKSIKLDNVLCKLSMTNARLIVANSIIHMRPLVKPHLQAGLPGIAAHVGQHPRQFGFVLHLVVEPAHLSEFGRGWELGAHQAVVIGAGPQVQQVNGFGKREGAVGG